MHRLLPALTLAACAWAQAQGAPDLMKTPECQAARQQLEAALAAGGPRDRVTAARREAAIRCFGVRLPEDPVEKGSPGHATLKSDRMPASPGPRNRVQPPPVMVDPIRLRPAPSLSHTATVPPVVSAPLLPPGPAVITTCDSSGCWDSTGARHNQQGPVLLGPRGACTVQGGLLNCP